MNPDLRVTRVSGESVDEEWLRTLEWTLGSLVSVRHFYGSSAGRDSASISIVFSRFHSIFIILNLRPRVVEPVTFRISYF